MDVRPVRIFLAGIMQGSHRSATLHDQSYRGRLADKLRRAVPGADVYDPLAQHADSLEYDDAHGQSVFFHHNRMCGEVDVLIAFVPEASMGTAIEMWEAFRHGRLVLAISPLVHNWTVKYCSHVLFPNLATFEADLESGRIATLIEQHRSSATASHST